MFRIKYIWVLLMIVALSSCEQGKYDREIEPPVELVSGEADFTNYVALGNSLTAGFSDGALFIESQNNSYPNLIAEKMMYAGGGEFVQPLMNDNTGGLLYGGVQIQSARLVTDLVSLAPLPKDPTTEVTNVITGPFKNMGVPGARSYHLLAPGFGDLANVPLQLANPYYARMASSSSATVLGDAMAQNPTFFSLWIGANDVLGYGQSGGDGSNDITDKALFDGSMAALISTLTSGGAKGVVGNIPNILTGAYFTAVPYAPLDPSNPEYAEQIPTLNAAYAQLNQAFAFLGVPERSVVFSETEASPVVIFDESLANISAQLNAVLIAGGLNPLTAGLLSQQYAQSRQANENDILTLTSQTAIAEINTEYFQQLVDMGVPAATAGQLSVNGLTYPLADTYVLIPTEQMEISDATAAFNATIAQLTTNAGLAAFDAFALINQIHESGYSSDGFNITTEFIFGGLFSLDGLHLTARGNAIVGNEMMKVIDATYESNFEEAGMLNDIGDYPQIYSAALP
ncbi:G-D-S-L family lipolytic protein [Lutimonas sp.]|uniref:G-D-S-L family lipolytic protein n=1 Tax=Lutimonas sp. TaxID=1872403 RepID=UPI003D9AD2CE